jgi:predicted transcriptional regulator
MLDALITSKTRIKLLLKFFLNPESNGYLRGLSTEFGESTNSIRIELNRLEEAGLLESDSNGNKKIFHANTKHPLFPDIQSIVRKYTGIDEVIEKVVKHPWRSQRSIFSRRFG